MSEQLQCPLKELNINRETGLAEGTMVQTRRGILPIEEVTAGDEVVDQSGNFQKVINISIHESQNIFDLKVEGNLLAQTTGDLLVFARKRRRRHEGHSFDEPQWIKVESLKKGDLIQQYQPKVCATIHITDEQAWLLGRYVADGYVYDSKRAGRKNSHWHRTVFCIGTKKADYFRRHLHTYHANESSTSNKNGSVIKFTISDDNLMRLAMQCGRGAINKTIPLWIFGLSRNQRKLFIDGYISGDGSVTRHGTIESITTISRKLAIGIAKLIDCTLNRPASVYFVSTPKHHVIEGRTINQHDQYQVHYKLIDNGNFWLHSKMIDGYMWKPAKIINKKILANPIKLFNLKFENNCVFNANGSICDGNINT